MKTELKTPLKIKGCGDVDSLFDAEGNYMADVTDLPFMLEVVRRVNAFDEIVLSLTRISNMNDLGNVREEARMALEKSRAK